MFKYLYIPPHSGNFFCVLIVDLILHKSQLQTILKSVTYAHTNVQSKGNKHNKSEILN